jgi:hypothetical protein
MKSQVFVKELVDAVNAFCRTLDDRLPAYSYIPLKTDEERVRVMQSRLFNELRAADLFGTWLRTTPEFEVKSLMAHEPFDYSPLPAQTAMFNALEGLTDTCQRIAGFSLAGESVATYLIQKSLQASHGSVPQEILKRYATTPERQDSARRAVAMRLVLFCEYLSSLDRWSMGKGPW